MAADELIKVNDITELKKFEFVGGMDNLLSLQELIDKHNNSPDCIIWLHGPQPFLLSSITGLEQISARRSLPDIYYHQFGEGQNLILNSLKKDQSFHALSEGMSEDFLISIDKLIQNKEVPQFISKKVPIIQVKEKYPKTSDHLTRLHIFDNICEQYFSGSTDVESLSEKAARYQIVSPVSGAVVLENEEQYRDAGLEAVQTDSVPTIPEPEVWALIIILLLILMFKLLKSRQQKVISA